jgi:hypothetical protein
MEVAVGGMEVAAGVTVVGDRVSAGTVVAIEGIGLGVDTGGVAVAAFGIGVVVGAPGPQPATRATKMTKTTVSAKSLHMSFLLSVGQRDIPHRYIF